MMLQTLIGLQMFFGIHDKPSYYRINIYFTRGMNKFGSVSITFLPVHNATHEMTGFLLFYSTTVLYLYLLLFFSYHRCLPSYLQGA
jgi:hypothetical protein